MLRYTPKQTRALVGITGETLRYWRLTLKPISACRGHGPVFTFGDVVALSVIAQLVKVFGVQVRNLAPVAESLFGQCNSRCWAQADKYFVILDLENKKVELEQSSIEAVVLGPSIIVPLRDLVQELNRQLTADEFSQDQQIFPFGLPAEERGV